MFNNGNIEFWSSGFAVIESNHDEVVKLLKSDGKL